ncbi:MAG: fibronectin type III domain-containing protein [Phycisphaerae bacterium]
MHKRRSRQLLESLESRVLLSATTAQLLTPPDSTATTLQQTQLLPTYKKLSTAHSLKPLQTAGPQGFTPAEISAAYGMNQITFGSVTGDGSGQTIAIIDAYNDPNIQSDFRAFSAAFNLPAPNLTVVNQNGSTANLPGVDPAGRGNSNFEGEEALDVEWSHAMAPGANILLVEANDASPSNLFAAVNMARNRPGVSVISMSFGGNETSNETAFDSTFTTPAGHNGVTFVASAGDSGQPGGYPAYSPNVVATGGTSLSINSLGTYQSESAWSGSGGGISRNEPQPSYQSGIVTQSSTRRTIPDVAFDADPSTGVAVYDSYNNGAAAPWEVIGGTSVSAPAWAGIFAVANQGRALAGQNALDSRSQTLPLLYAAPAADFHDITTGNNGFNAAPGYDLVTGRGSPQANLLIPFLVSGNTTVTTPPTPRVSSAFLSADQTTVNQGTPVTITANGVVDSGSGVAVTFSEESNGLPGLQTGPGGDTAFTPVTDGSNAITFDTSNAVGQFTIYAQVTDASGAASATGTDAPSITISVNAPTNAGPSIASISASPNPVPTGDILTLTANGISDPDAPIRRVYFYQETNNIPGLQTGPGGDFAFRPVSAFSNFSIDLDTTGVTGSQTFYALAVDTLGDISPTGTAAPTVTVNITSAAPPAAPFNLTAHPAAPTAINLQFHEPDSTQTGFTIERATDPHFLNFVQLFTINRPNLLTYADTGLHPNTTYYYRVEAFNAAGNSTFSNTASATTPLGPTHLVITQQPAATTIAGRLLSVTVAVENAKNQVVSTDTSNVTISVASGPAGGALSGTYTVSAVNGIAHFADLFLTRAGTYRLYATDRPLHLATSSPLTITPDTAHAHLIITRQPLPILQGRTLSPLVVQARDRFGNLLANIPGAVTLVTPGKSGIIGGPLTQSSKTGIFTFTHLVALTPSHTNILLRSTSLPGRPWTSYTQVINPTALAKKKSQPSTASNVTLVTTTPVRLKPPFAR